MSIADPTTAASRINWALINWALINWALNLFGTVFSVDISPGARPEIQKSD